jgi:F-type H+-transporting ATPase subunit delta
MNREKGKDSSREDIKDIYGDAAASAGSISCDTYVEVVSAVELDSSMMDKIKKYVEGAVGDQVILKNKVDSSIIGGLVIKIGEKVIDLSIRDRLEDIKANLKAVDIGGEGFDAKD